MTTETTSATEAEAEAPAGTPTEQALAEKRAEADTNIAAADASNSAARDYANAKEVGRLARRNGESREKACDYPEGSESAKAWAEGFDEEDKAIAERAKDARENLPDGEGG